MRWAGPSSQEKCRIIKTLMVGRKNWFQNRCLKHTGPHPKSCYQFSLCPYLAFMGRKLSRHLGYPQSSSKHRQSLISGIPQEPPGKIFLPGEGTRHSLFFQLSQSANPSKASRFLLAKWWDTCPVLCAEGNPTGRSNLSTNQHQVREKELGWL